MENEVSSDQFKKLIKRLLWEAKNKFKIPEEIILESETSDSSRWKAVYSLGGVKLTAFIDNHLEDLTYYQFDFASSNEKSDDVVIYVSQELYRNNLTVQNVNLHDENRRNEVSARKANLGWSSMLESISDFTDSDSSIDAFDEDKET